MAVSYKILRKMLTVITHAIYVSDQKLFEPPNSGSIIGQYVRMAYKYLNCHQLHLVLIGHLYLYYNNIALCLCVQHYATTWLVFPPINSTLQKMLNFTQSDVCRRIHALRKSISFGANMMLLFSNCSLYYSKMSI